MELQGAPVRLSVDPSKPGAAPEAECGLSDISLKRQLKACRSQLLKTRWALLQQNQRLRRRVQRYNRSLRRQVEKLSREIHEWKQREKNDAAVQTEDYTVWSHSDYQSQNYYQNNDLSTNVSEVQGLADKGNDGVHPKTTDQLTSEGNVHSGVVYAATAEEQENGPMQNSEELEGTSLAESLRATAEAAVSQTGFTYDESSGLYYDYNTGFYYDSESKLYYDPNTGIYYYLDVESGRYQFHSRVDLQSYQMDCSSTLLAKEKKGKSKKQDLYMTTTNEETGLNTEKQKSSSSSHYQNLTNGQVSYLERKESAYKKKKEANVAMETRNGPLNVDKQIDTKSTDSQSDTNKKDIVPQEDESDSVQSEPEEGEITDSENKDCSDEDVSSIAPGTSGNSEQEDDEMIWLPWVRVIVIRSPVLKAGSLYTITAKERATVGRLTGQTEQFKHGKKDLGHTIVIPEAAVSKFHAEVFFDHELQSYVIVDQGSQTGTVINGRLMLQPGIVSEPNLLEHGDEVRFGETVLCFHVHPSRKTCDGCEPGQIQAHFYLNTESPTSSDTERIWPPCIRVIVIRSPVLQTGSLYIITATKHATIGREQDLEHTILIPEATVSKFHAEVFFDHELESYVIVDQGSQTGTVINGNPVLQPDVISEPYVLKHGDEVKFGETVLSFHVHPGCETCNGCEPGQIRAHLRLDDKSPTSSVGPVLSKEEKELVRRKELKQMRVKYGLQSIDYENIKALKNPKYMDRAAKRRKRVGSEGSFQRDDAPASVHVEIDDSNKGRKMLEQMGWKKGEGLGKDGSGMKDPIQLQLRKKQAGLGASTPGSVEDASATSKNKHNWEKARERFFETFQNVNLKEDLPKPISWVKGTVE
ncbi:angiogenic factor with G patch and FHA domains 1 isoform X2 [Microcaecilia unicolor]|uniref:Angiogenic factor with G patch and FHA domains 1 isoform X2 n=1 Tax=Microcaecilia unicolor TaxID=1415580 RepID=A0A6P7XFU8_9AMPH|nr:angiogenic factor with G patch and FHA domains 1 isoform X2 [Microcaecilia unicolor]